MNQVLRGSRWDSTSDSPKITDWRVARRRTQLRKSDVPQTIGQTDRVKKSAMGTPLHLPLFSNPCAVNAPFPKQCLSSTSFCPNPLVQTMHLPTGHGLYERICTKASAPHAIAKRIEQKNGAWEMHIPSLPPWRIRRPLPSHSPPPPSSSFNRRHLYSWRHLLPPSCREYHSNSER